MRRGLSLIVVLLFVFALIVPVMAIEHPSVVVYGIVTKDVKTGVKWQLYNISGVDQELPFTARDNYTFYIKAIEFVEPFANDTYTTSDVGSEDTVAKYIDDNGITYLYLENVLSSQTNNQEIFTVSIKVNIPVTENTIFMFYYENIEHDSGDLGIILTLVSGGTSYSLGFIDAPGVSNFVLISPNKIYQFYIEKTYASLTGNTVDFDSVTQIDLKVRIINDTSLTDEYITSKVYFLFFTESEVYVNNENYLLNNTNVMNIPTSIGDVLNIYGADATTIHDVQIPFKYTVEPTITLDPDNLKMSYRWSFILPKHDELTYSNTVLNLTLNKDGSAYDYLYVKGSDMLSSILDKTAGTEVTLVSGLIAGDQYDVELRVSYTASEYDELTEAPIFWVNPIAWLSYKFWKILIAIASVLGLSTAWATRRKRRLRIPKRRR